MPVRRPNALIQTATVPTSEGRLSEPTRSHRFCQRRTGVGLAAAVAVATACAAGLSTATASASASACNEAIPIAEELAITEGSPTTEAYSVAEKIQQDGSARHGQANRDASSKGRTAQGHEAATAAERGSVQVERGSVQKTGFLQVRPSRIASPEDPSRESVRNGPDHVEKQEAKFVPRHVTLDLMNRRGYSTVQADLQRLQQWRKANPPSAVEQGAVRSFDVRNVLNQDEWTTERAELVFRASNVQIWVEQGEAQRMRQNNRLNHVVQSLSHALQERTPQGSVDPSAGMLDIVHRHFGTPPDVDGDGRLDILLLDIRDRYQQNGAFVAGFFDPNDLTTDARSNRRDLLYVDTRPTLIRDNSVDTELAAATIVHEYQHLVHANYEGRELETTFLNEGLSEVAEILSGFSPRDPTAYFADSGRPLLSWQYDAPIPDYARASLFTHYLVETVGLDFIDDLVQSPSRHGTEVLEYVLQESGGPPLVDLVQDWGRATLLPDPAEEVAYRHPARRHVGREAGRASVQQLPEVRRGQLGALSNVVLEIPIVRELLLSAYGTDAKARLSASVAYPDGRRRRLPRIAPETSVPLDPSGHGTVRVVVSNVSASPDTASSEVDIVARGRRSVEQRTIQYDDGTPEAFGGGAQYLLVEKPGERLGLVFGAEDQAWLHGVSVNALFMNEVAGSGVPKSAPRILTTEIRSVQNGRPGRRLTDPVEHVVQRDFGRVGSIQVSLAEAYDDLSVLPDSFVVAVGSADPANPVAIAMDATEGSNAGSGFHRENGPWRRLASVQVEGASLEGFRPILRAHVTVPQSQNASSALEAEVARDFDRVFVRFDAPFPIDPGASRIVARLPSGRYAQSLSAASPDSIRNVFEEPVSGPAVMVFELPVEVDGSYRIDARIASTKGKVMRRTVRWQMPVASTAVAGAPYPNPTGTSTTLPITLREQARVDVVLYDVLGRRVRRAYSKTLASGPHRIPLRLRSLASGAYFARIIVHRTRDGHTTRDVRKVVVAR